MTKRDVTTILLALDVAVESEIAFVDALSRDGKPRPRQGRTVAQVERRIERFDELRRRLRGLPPKGVV